MISSKKKSTMAKIPKPIKVKKEKTEDSAEKIHPMSHYVDDRLELTKQIFSTLKPKTITNLAPDFLKQSSLEDIEELCLNELLGISTKRLLSIINATKCPTDTESSSDSDVNNIEEHISLEEISSDSEVEKNTKDSGKVNDSKTNSGDGKINVLELLELQARARAIRSQLALEPVTKIDVDSNDEAVSNNKAKNQKKTESASNKKASLRNKEKAKSSTNGNTRNSKLDKTMPTQQKIKLKRNFRKRTEGTEQLEEADTTVPTNHIAQLSEERVKEEKRSQSPDVIPILPVTETLYISDSSSEPSKDADESTKVVDNSCEDNQQRVPSEAEDGEITDDNDNNAKNPSAEDSTEKNTDTLSSTAAQLPTEEDVARTSSKDEHTDLVIKEPSETKTTEMKASPSLAVQHLTSNETNDQSENIASKNIDNSEGDDNEHNDDVISIEGGDLESEMIEHLEKSQNTVDAVKTLTNNCNDEEDIITLNDSSDEEYDNDIKDNTSESWNARWLKSSKVSKVLATSRLGNRLRDKIKQSKRTQEIAKQEEEELAQRTSKNPAIISRHELGSVEQYKELVEMQKKT